jgi:hypothetical protein
MTPNSPSRGATSARPLIPLVPLLALLAAGCELEVTNPGPVQADFLESPAALTSVVNGAGRDLGEALNYTAYTGAAVARELFPAGSTAAFGISVRQQAGRLTDDDGNDWWNRAQRARWTAENAVDRVKRVLGADAARNATLAQALVWAGYANRHLGENFCEGIIDGGAPGPSTVYFERAEAQFTEAIAVATAANNAALLSAATAGRASVRLSRNNLAGAATDAATVASTFAYRMPYYQNDEAQYNRVYWSSANQPYRAHTVFNTFYEGYRRSSRDPRVPYDSSATVLLGDAAVTYNGVSQRVRWYFQTKYPAITSPINLSTGWEMRLVEAEAKLAGGDVPGALTLMNQRRTALSLPLLAAGNATEAWTLLKRERGIELWLESRRLGDFRRWAAFGRPGTTEDMTGRDLCFATALSEKQSNPNYGT